MDRDPRQKCRGINSTRSRRERPESRGVRQETCGAVLSPISSIASGEGRKGMARRGDRASKNRLFRQKSRSPDDSAPGPNGAGSRYVCRHSR